MRGKLFVAALAALAPLAVAAAAGAASYSNLSPGETASLNERVPVNVVFVGFEPGQVPEAAFLGGLPQRYKPVVRSRLWYGVVEELGIDYTYDYEVTYATAAWENSFFTALRGLATPAPRTLFQDDYNAQAGTRDVGQNHFIDAPSVEKWLIANAPAGVDTRQNTVFLINWWGRPDFVDHVYTKIGEPDPDTGYDFGIQRASRKIIAWGGTPQNDEETGLGSLGTHRVWFFDLSGGPEAWGGSYDVTNPDIDGDDVPDYRLPAAWEYAAGGYRSPAALTGDLALLTRYAPINLMFTSSPLYPPALTPPGLPSSINMDLNTYEAWDGVDASATYQKLPLLVAEEGELFATPFSADNEDVPFRSRARSCYLMWLESDPCYEDRPQYPGDANLFLNAALNRQRFTDGGGEYEAVGFNYSTSDDIAPGFLGFADDNWVDGTQSFVFNFISQSVVDAGYGLTTTQIHEFGHHFGMSHPHDGFDWETGIDYEPTGPFFVGWAGDEHNSMMSYIDLNWDFSQFDRDNANRFQAAAYITNANAIAADILASKRPDRAAGDLAAADAEVGKAEAAFAAHDYPTARAHAVAAYNHVFRGAQRTGVRVESSKNGWSVLPKPAREERVGSFFYAAADKFGPGTQRGKP
jgi:hypothetical protein